MNLFRKTTTNTTKDAAEVSTRPAPTENTASSNVIGTADQQTVEEVARRWWKEKYGDTMPEEVIRWMKQLTRAEARRLETVNALLSPQQLARTEDAIRLSETKLRNIDQSLQRIHYQLQWLQRYNENKHELAEHQQRLYEVNKVLAATANDERELERFETFETIQGLFQRMTLLEKQSRQNKQMQSTLARQREQWQQTVNENQKQLSQLADNQHEAEKQMEQANELLEEANRILGARTVLELDEQALESLLQNVHEQREQLQQQLAELTTELAQARADMTRMSSERQTMEPHQRLMEHAEMAQTLLDRLYELSLSLQELSRSEATALNRQKEENEMLSRIFSEYQSVEQHIKSLNDELYLHRQQNLGQSSYRLQERAMQLKSRRQMLISAQSLWNRIAAGYQLIEEKTQEINRLRLEKEHLRQNIEELEDKVVPMRQLCHEKEYTLTLSKSQNVIQLRSDLKEGVSCTVCGATYHPYHSDTVLEQSKLISELRTDFELLKAELVSKEETLRQLQTQYTATSTRCETEETMLSQLRHRQMEDVKEWDVFAPLDRTFQECSPSTNQAARVTMLRQLIENAEVEADNALRDLDDYNQHQTRINELAEEVTRKEQQRSDLNLRLNEVNTGCQVLARQVESIRQQRNDVQDAYARLYEQLNGMLTLEKWYADWQQNHDGLRLRIDDMQQKWQRLNRDIPLCQHRQDMAEALIEQKQNILKWMDILQLRLRELKEKRLNMRKEGEKNYETMLGQQDVKSFYAQARQRQQQATERAKEQREITQEHSLRLATVEGQLETLQGIGTETDAQTVNERSKLDIWMRQFNANHPPVQYAELEHAFANDRDWNALRQQIRGRRIESMLEQARVDALRSTIVALQAEGVQHSGNEEDMQESLVAQQKQLERQRNGVMMQMAALRIAIERHQEHTERLKAEEEELYNMTTERT